VETSQGIGINGKQPALLWLGRIEPIKNLDVLIEALAGLKDLGWHLDIAGPKDSPSYALSLERMVERHGLGVRIRFLGSVYGPEKDALLRGAYALVLVSYGENWGNVVTEALAAGTPVLVADSCGVSDIVRDGGGIVVQSSLPSVREGLRKLLTDTVLYNECKSKAMAVGDRFNWEGPVGEMESVFESLVRKEPGREPGANPR
jgi:poly(glycerol-phosphate) alpha-glucosyltransferase